MLLTLLLLSGSIALVWGIARAAGGTSNPPPFSIDLPSGVGRAEIVGVVQTPEVVGCLGTEIDKVLSLLKDQKLEVIRTKLSPSHTVLVDAVKAPHARVTLSGAEPSHVFISLADNGRLVVPYTEWSEHTSLPWRSVSKDHGVALSKCVGR